MMVVLIRFDLTTRKGLGLNEYKREELRQRAAVFKESAESVTKQVKGGIIMGTRAAFWVGDPRNIETRQWLGCKALDGGPGSLPELDTVESVEGFLCAVQAIAEKSKRYFAFPSADDWPYPWDRDIFLTDYNYAFFDDQVQVAHYHSGFIPWSRLNDRNPFESVHDTLPGNVPAPKPYDPGQPDSIMIVRRR